MKAYSIILLLSFALLSHCENLDVSQEPVLIKRIDVRYNDTMQNVFIFRSFSNATVNDAIFIKKEESQEYASHIFNRYDSLVSYSVNDSLLSLQLLDISHSVGSTETVSLKEVFK